MPKHPNIFQFKITLVGSRSPIWRRVQVSAEYSFWGLHVAIQDAFGWTDTHLHQFLTDNPYKRNARFECIAFPMPEMENVIDERTEKIKSYFIKPKDTLFYEYDFGDSWMHEVKLEKTLPKEKEVDYPRLLDGKNACPFEDSGGLGGYYEKIEILKNPKDKEHEDVLEWLGLDDPKDFDPEAFDPDEIEFQNPKARLKEFEEQFPL